MYTILKTPLFLKGKPSIRNCLVFAFAICILSYHYLIKWHQGSAAAAHGTQHAKAQAMHHLWDYRSRGPIGSPRAPTGSADTPPLGRSQHWLDSRWLLFLSVHLPAKVAPSLYEAWFTDTLSCNITLWWHRANRVAITEHAEVFLWVPPHSGL